MDIWVGEWSLATDVCALWLGGFNDNNTPYCDQCEWVDCPYSYLPADTAADFDRTAEEPLGPFGTNDLSTVQSGKCPRDSARYTPEEVQTLGDCVMTIFNDTIQGHFMWTWKNELEPKWSYQWAWSNGWVNQNIGNSAEVLQ